jgi:class 3 adenylate cyclase
MGATQDVGAPSARFEERTLVMVLADLAGFTRAVSSLTAVEIAGVIDRFYVLCADLVAAHGGRVVKYSGDNCMAVFGAAQAPAAVAYATSLRDGVAALASELDIAIELGANVHMATVATGRIGGGTMATDDIAGMGVVHTYRMGAGAGIRISEPVYRKLASSERGPWRKHQPPATYTFEP